MIIKKSGNNGHITSEVVLLNHQKIIRTYNKTWLPNYRRPVPYRNRVEVIFINIGTEIILWIFSTGFLQSLHRVLGSHLVLCNALSLLFITAGIVGVDQIQVKLGELLKTRRGANEDNPVQDFLINYSGKWFTHRERSFLWNLLVTLSTEHRLKITLLSHSSSFYQLRPISHSIHLWRGHFQDAAPTQETPNVVDHGADIYAAVRGDLVPSGLELGVTWWVSQSWGGFF